MKSALVWIALAACTSQPAPGMACGDCDVFPDAPPRIVETNCDVLDEAGCTSGTKCTWALVTDPTPTARGLGTITCVPDGLLAVGTACTTRAAFEGGYDDCMSGAFCLNGTCTQICDLAGGAPRCDATRSCVLEPGVFQNIGGSFYPAGLCDMP